jgi:hypothetical protein
MSYLKLFAYAGTLMLWLQVAVADEKPVVIEAELLTDTIRIEEEMEIRIKVTNKSEQPLRLFDTEFVNQVGYYSARVDLIVNDDQMSYGIDLPWVGGTYPTEENWYKMLPDSREHFIRRVNTLNPKYLISKKGDVKLQVHEVGKDATTRYGLKLTVYTRFISPPPIVPYDASRSDVRKLFEKWSKDHNDEFFVSPVMPFKVLRDAP